MKKPKARQTKIPLIPAPILNLAEFEALTDCLYEAVKGNKAQIARLLGISPITWDKWIHKPPKWPWWNMILRHVIKHVLAELRNTRGVTQHHRNAVLEAFNRIPDSDVLAAQVERLASDYKGAEAHLIRRLSKKGMYWDELRLPANCGGYTAQMLRIAAKKLSVIKTQEGYGSHKRSYWRLSDEDDEDWAE